ncbi:HNH endonuclease [Spirosoma telluris]
MQPVSENGDNSYDNLTTCCFACNSKRGATPILDFIAH